MKAQVTSKLARLSGRLAELGRRYQSVEQRISAVKTTARADQELITRRLMREKARLEREMHCYEIALRSLSGTLPDNGGRLHRLAS